MSLNDFLVWLMSGGAVVAVSWIFEEIEWFQSLSPKTKRYFQYGLSVLFGVSALLVQQFVPADVLKMLNPYFEILAATFGMIFLNQVAHTLNPNRKAKG